MRKYRFSSERDKIHKILCSTKTHPTAEWIYEQLLAQEEKISVATVYRNLGILCDQGLAKKLEIQGETHAHFDGDISEHHHFVCKKWNKIFDVKTLPVSLPQNLQYYGMCSQCL